MEELLMNEGFRDYDTVNVILMTDTIGIKRPPVAEFNIKDDIVLNIHDCHLHPAIYIPQIVKRSRDWSWYNRKAVDIEKVYNICSCL